MFVQLSIVLFNNFSDEQIKVHLMHDDDVRLMRDVHNFKMGLQRSKII